MIPEAAEKYIYYREPGIVLLYGDCRDILPLLEPETIQCCVTSPPYWGLRDYGISEQIGLEKMPDEYVGIMISVFDSIKRVMKSDGTLWLNLGDSYTPQSTHKCLGNRGGNYNQLARDVKDKRHIQTYGKPKDLVGIPWRVAFALQAAGWYLRSDIIWHKPNPMPESVTDRPTRAHEYIFLMSKAEKYYYDSEAIKEDAKSTDMKKFTDKGKDKKRGHSRRHAGFNGRYAEKLKIDGIPKTRNRRDVWTIATKPYKGAHFAVFPPELIEPCILAGTKEGDIVIDPFSGSSTVGHVCKKFKRRYIGIELNKEYLELSPDRIGRQGILL